MDHARLSRRIVWAACVGVLAIAAAMALEAEPQPAQTVLDPQETTLGETCDLAQAVDGETSEVAPDAVRDADLGFTELDAQPAAICRMAPECDTNSDCDAICGVGQGRCGHSRCPIRVCKCS